MLERIKGAVTLDSETYELVENDAKYMGEAVLIVAITSVLTGIGAWISTGSFAGFIALLIIGFLGWVIWAAITLFIGRGLFGGTADMGEMLRVLGYARAPLALAVVPFVGLLVGSIWSLVCSIVAIRQGLDFTTGKALLTAGIGWVALLIVNGILSFVIG